MGEIARFLFKSPDKWRSWIAFRKTHGPVCVRLIQDRQEATTHFGHCFVDAAFESELVNCCCCYC